MNLPKLSEAQKKVVADLRQGKSMYKHNTYVIVINGGCVYISTYFSLVKKGIIETFGKCSSQFGIQCRLTKLGQEIKID